MVNKIDEIVENRAVKNHDLERKLLNLPKNLLKKNYSSIFVFESNTINIVNSAIIIKLVSNLSSN